MTSIIWAPQAIEDVEAIRAYVAHDSKQYANLLVVQIVAAVTRLETFPHSGRVVPRWETKPSARLFQATIESYTVLSLML